MRPRATSPVMRRALLLLTIVACAQESTPPDPQEPPLDLNEMTQKGWDMFRAADTPHRPGVFRRLITRFPDAPIPYSDSAGATSNGTACARPRSVRSCAAPRRRNDALAGTVVAASALALDSIAVDAAYRIHRTDYIFQGNPQFGYHKSYTCAPWPSSTCYGGQIATRRSGFSIRNSVSTSPRWTSASSSSRRSMACGTDHETPTEPAPAPVPHRGSGLVGNSGHRSRAAGSWQVRNLPTGSGVRVETVAPSTFYLIGDFDGSREWTSTDGGSSGSIRNPGSAIRRGQRGELQRDVGHQGAVTLDGLLWHGTRDGRSGTSLRAPDTLGTPSAVFCRQGGALWVGTLEGELLRVDPSATPAAWTRTASLGEAPVDRIVPSDDNLLCVHLRDGSLLASSSPLSLRPVAARAVRADSGWVAAPFRASQVDMTRTRRGYAIESGSLTLWKTTDAGERWTPVSDALAEPQLRPWAEQARRLILRDGFGVIACGDVLLATTDEGRSWRIAAAGVGMFLDAAIDALDELVTTGGEIHRSSDRANSMVQIFGGEFSHVEMSSISTGWAHDRGLLLTVSQGERWLRQPIPDSADRLTRIAARGDYEIWLHFDGPAGPRSYYSGNRGAVYDELDLAGALRGLRGWSFPEPGIGWAWADSAVFRSRNDGVDWDQVHTAPEVITAMAVRDSLDAVFATRTRFILTRDGGRTWAEWESPRAAAVRALCWRDADRFVAAGWGISTLRAESGGEEIAGSSLPDTVRSVALAENGTGWASGDAGTLAGTSDGGSSWSLYRVSLEMNALTADLGALSLVDSDHAATGAGTTLIRLLPDGSGPVFRYGVSANPYLPEYLDIHVTARERLQRRRAGNHD